MTDRTPDFNVASFGDGLLDGVRFDLPRDPVSVTVVMGDGRVLRYESDQTMTTESREDGTWGDAWRLVETRDAAEYDSDLLEDLRRTQGA